MPVHSFVLSQTDFIDHTQLTYPFQERGLQFGDGVYEVIRVYQSNYYLLDAHVERLYRSAEAIKLKLPFEKEELYHNLGELLRKNEITGDAKVYLQVTRGSAVRDHLFPDVTANFYAYVQDVPRPLDKLKYGVKAVTLPDTRWQNCYIKSLNLLPNILAKQEANEQNAFEAVLHRDETVTECSASNVYIVKDKTIYTHPATNQILHGCVRSRIKVLAKSLNIPFKEEAFTLQQLEEADEVFLSSSTAEVMPIVEVNQQAIQTGKPGEVTRQLQKAYEKDAALV